MKEAQAWMHFRWHTGGEFTTFAYGTNMSSARLRRLGVQPLRSFRAELTNYRMSFDGCLTRQRLRHGSATIMADYPATVHGVLHVLPNRARCVLDLLEMVPLGCYRRIDVSVRLDSGEYERAQAYISNTVAPGGMPSRRYLKQILTGAKEFDLPYTWVRWLESYKSARC